MNLPLFPPSLGRFKVDGSSSPADINNVNPRGSPLSPDGRKGNLRPEIGPAVMNFKKRYILPEHLRDGRGLPRSRTERLLMIRRRIEEGYYDTERVKLAVAEAFLDPPGFRRAGDQAYPS